MSTPTRTESAAEELNMRNVKSTTTVMRTKSIGLVAGAAAVVALGGAPAALNGQEAETKTGWQPYLGCWEPQLAASGDWMLSGTEVDEGILCFVPGGADVEMLTVVEGSIAYRESFRTDGQPRAIEQEGCTGQESARFSDDRRRIYTISEMSCEGEAPRRSTGIISMPSPGEWLDVRAIEMNGVSTAWSQWYQRTDGSVLRELGFADLDMPSPFSVRSAAAYANTVISIDDVIDASANVDPRAVEGWIAAVRQEFINLDADDLIRLEEAGVSAKVIDVVVAVSFPERFAFGQQGAPADGAEDPRVARTIYADRCSYYNDPFRYGYGSRYGYRGYSPGCGYGYNRYGYGYGGYGYGGWGGGYVPVVVNVNRTPRSSGGRVVAGRGYRGPRSIGSTGSSGSGRSWVGSSGGSRGSSGGSSGGRKAKRRGGSFMSSGNSVIRSMPSGSSVIRSMPSISGRSSSSSSSGSSTGRTAKPRGGRQ
jgi:hypothetical protein